jgi:hypothetical protein
MWPLAFDTIGLYGRIFISNPALPGSVDGVDV